MTHKGSKRVLDVRKERHFLPAERKATMRRTINDSNLKKSCGNERVALGGYNAHFRLGH